MTQFARCAPTACCCGGCRYAEAHDGEGCPANWKPGKATIKANPFGGSKEYFASDEYVRKGL